MNLALVFPGQGSQSKNMLSDFIGDPDFKEIISQASEILGYDIEKIVEDEEKSTTQFIHSQLCLLHHMLCGY